ncbi:hypothetical protein DYL72_15450 [Vibrio anguillarum]|uniref:Uncharacterized protein n=1 Tax=Vibrio anguillarum TaxID=55601 RepID=A0A7U6FS48_VIBAN|nr:hypothetical protein [Vibrio anguillarum]AZS26303.1 hypothetical protein DYL72_15450 [Vibrio anguillarum]
MENIELDRHVDKFISEGLASCYNGTIDSLIAPIVMYGDDNNVIEITVGTLAMKQFARLVINQLKLSFIYKIYDINDYGDQSVYVESLMPLEDIRDACRYISLKGEQILVDVFNEEGISPSNFAIAAILISHYGCAASPREVDATPLERYELSTGSGHSYEADQRFESQIPSDLDGMMEVLRLLLATTNGLDNVNSHYIKYQALEEKLRFS